MTACSGDLAERAIQLGADADATTVVPYGVHGDQFKPVDDATRAAVRAWYGLPPETPLLLCAGRLVYKKGFAVAVDAFARIAEAQPAARLVIAGDGPLDVDLRAQAARLGIGRACHLCRPCGSGAASAAGWGVRLLSAHIGA